MIQRCLDLFLPKKQPLPPYQKAYRFTTDWFTPRIDLWKQHLKPLRGKPHLKALEIGSYEGRSALWLLENILTAKSSKLICIDPYTDIRLKPIEKTFRENIDLGGFGERIDLRLGLSHDILPNITDEKFDLIYIDGHHEGIQVELDANLCWRLLKPGGTMIFDDYAFPAELAPGEPPKLGIDRFLEQNRKQIRILHKDYQVILKKI